MILVLLCFLFFFQKFDSRDIIFKQDCASLAVCFPLFVVNSALLWKKVIEGQKHFALVKKSSTFLKKQAEELVDDKIMHFDCYQFF